MLKKIRVRAGLTQTKIAVHLGIKPQTVNMWEHGKSTPSIRLLKPLAKLLNVTVEEVLDCFDK